MKAKTRPKHLSIYVLFFVILCLGCSPERATDSQENPTTEPGSWTLIFEDEFNDLSAWNIWYGGAFNNEIQLYRREQLKLDSGILKIMAKREAISGPTLPHDKTPKNFEYVSGRIETKQLFGPSDEEGERMYRIMARLKLPSGHGMWPAFWSYGDPWPTQGEIDILEARGSEKEVFGSNIFYGRTPGINLNKDTEVRHEMGLDLTSDFHVYELIWEEESLEIFFDNQLIQRYEANGDNNVINLFGTKQKVVLNTAVGGWYFEDTDSGNFADSSVMEIDWIRVYRR